MENLFYFCDSCKNVRGQTILSKTFKRLASISFVFILAFVGILPTVSLKAEEIDRIQFEYEGGIYEIDPTWSFEGEMCTYVRPASEEQTEIVIPDRVTYDLGYNSSEFLVVHIDGAAFTDNKTISSITIGKNVLSIWESEGELFKGCSNLSKISLLGNKDKEGFSFSRNLRKSDFSGIKKGCKVYVPKDQYKNMKKLAKKARNIKIKKIDGEDPEDIQDLVKEYVDKTFMQGVNPNWSDFHKALYAYDYLTAQNSYDHTYRFYWIESALLRGTSVCQGYAEAYCYLMYQLGIPCYEVSSREMNHAWNMITLNGKEYYVDATWDDGSMPTGVIENHPGSAHYYFLKSENAIRKEGHDTNDWVYRVYVPGISKGPFKSWNFKTLGGNFIYDATDTTYDNVIWKTGKAGLAMAGNEIVAISSHIDQTGTDPKRHTVWRLDEATGTKADLIFGEEDAWSTETGLSSTGLWNGYYFFTDYGEDVWYFRPGTDYEPRLLRTFKFSGETDTGVCRYNYFMIDGNNLIYVLYNCASEEDYENNIYQRFEEVVDLNSVLD